MQKTFKVDVALNVRVEVMSATLVEGLAMATKSGHKVKVKVSTL